MMVLGVVMLAVVAAAVAVALRMATRHADEESPPSSVPTDFVAPMSSGGYAFRGTDESEEEFRARVARERGQEPPKA